MLFPATYHLKKALALASLAAVLACLNSAPVPAQERPVVYLVQIEGVIDLGLAPFVQRVVDEAADVGAAAVVLQIDTLGGRVDAAVMIRDALLKSRVRTIAFVNRRAISAGALIALAAEKIAMAPGSNIGAATPVAGGDPGEESKTAPEKTISYVRSEFRATAEMRNRSSAVAEAMVDPDVEIPGVIGKEKLLTLTADQALKLKLADFEANDLNAVLQTLGLSGAEIRSARKNWAESLVRLLTHPIASSLLMTIGFLGIMVELRTPGFGAPGLIGIASLALFFWGHWIVRLAGWEELLLIVVGLILLALEIFVIPGFGVAGGVGILSLLAGLALSLVGTGVAWSGIVTAIARVSVSLVAAIGLGALLLAMTPRLPFARRLVLQDAIVRDESEESEERRWIGMTGVALSPLRPAGIATVEGRRLDVVSEGELIEPGETIKVIRVDGNRIVVQRTSPQDSNLS